ncbi:hypothetical protein L1887_11825 [Cichorium endivia]|nr:hypothetical protein L1887_11825 [Cichorium endivia]
MEHHFHRLLHRLCPTITVHPLLANFSPATSTGCQSFIGSSLDGPSLSSPTYEGYSSRQYRQWQSQMTGHGFCFPSPVTPSLVNSFPEYHDNCWIS